MLPIVNEYVQIINQFYNKTAKEIKIFKSIYEKEIALGLIMTINASFMCIFLLVVFALLKIFVGIFRSFATFIWDNLTPGQKWLELTMILSSFLTFVVVAYAAMDMEKKIDESFKKLKKEIAVKDSIIAEKDDKIAKLEGNITDILNKSSHNNVDLDRNINDWWEQNNKK
jgi:hypothetical protein